MSEIIKYYTYKQHNLNIIIIINITIKCDYYLYYNINKKVFSKSNIYKFDPERKFEKMARSVIIAIGFNILNI